MKKTKPKPKTAAPVDDLSPRSRARMVEKILAKVAKEYGTKIEEDAETVVSDFLADLRHFCDAKKLDFAEMDRRGYGHYATEAQEARAEARRRKAARS